MARLRSWLRRRLAVVAAVLVVAALVLAGLLSTPVGSRAASRAGRAIDRATARVFQVTPAGPVVVERIQALQRLETASHTAYEVIHAKSASPVLGDLLSRDELTLVAQARVTAGVDLARLGAADVVVDGRTVTVRLPEAQIFDVKLDDRYSEVVARERGLLNFSPDKDLERQARLEAQEQAVATAEQHGLLDTAQRNAETSLTGLLRTLGFEDIRFLTGPAVKP